MPRQTADLVALILAVVVAVTVVLTVFVIGWVTINQPDQDLSDAADAIGRIVGVLVAALVGYMAGRRVNGNGGGHDATAQG